MLPQLKKGTKYDYAYQEGPNTPPRCNKCQYYTQSGECILVKGAISGYNGSCNFWVNGESAPQKGLRISPYTKPEAGYVEARGGPACGGCAFFRDPMHCKLVKGKIDPKIGCCNAWKRK